MKRSYESLNRETGNCIITWKKIYIFEESCKSWLSVAVPCVSSNLSSFLLQWTNKRWVIDRHHPLMRKDLEGGGIVDVDPVEECNDGERNGHSRTTKWWIHPRTGLAGRVENESHSKLLAPEHDTGWDSIPLLEHWRGWELQVDSW